MRISTKLVQSTVSRCNGLSKMRFSSGVTHGSGDHPPLYGGLTSEAFHFMVEKGPPFTAQHFKPKITLLEHGRLEMVLPYNEGLVGNVMIPCYHGGVVATMLDHTAGFAAWSNLPDAYHRTSTVQLIVDYLAPPPCEDLLFVGRIDHQTNRLIRSSAICWTMDRKKQIAFGKAIFNVYKSPDNLAELGLIRRAAVTAKSDHHTPVVDGKNLDR